MASSVASLFVFFQQARIEASRVTWPSRRETVISTVMVVLFSMIAMVFFFLADHLLAYGIEFFLNIGHE